MRLNRYIALATGLSRRAADRMVAAGKVRVNNFTAELGQQVQTNDTVTLNNSIISVPNTASTILLNKPVGYVSSRDGQGSRTIYDLLPRHLHALKPVGRLDKDSSGLLLLTNDGKLVQRLSHPSFQKEKMYEVELNKPLRPEDKTKIETGVKLEDGISKLVLSSKKEASTYKVIMHEGRNRQIRRTFDSLGYRVITLHRTQLGHYRLGNLASGKYKNL